MGSGTTLVEAKILGRNALGIYINPLACLISNAKTINLQCSELKEISDISASIKQRSVTLLNFGDNRKTIDESVVINRLHPNIWKWFHKNVIYELFVIKNRIESLKSKHIRDFLLVSFSSILRSVSNATSGFGNLMINKHAIPKNRVYEKFAFAVNDMINGMLEFNKISTDSRVEIFNQDTRNLGFINNETVDFICTHPPYMAAVPYAEYQKLSLWWLDFSQYVLERALIGGQRSRADTPDRFFRDMRNTLVEMKGILRKKKYCCITIGNPIYNRKVWPLNEIIKKEAEALGFILLREINRGKYKSTMGKMKELGMNEICKKCFDLI